MSVFDGMADIFTDTFGEFVIYTPIATGVPLGANGTINAIWWESSMDVALGAAIVAEVDANRTQLSVNICDVPAPAEGDTARRVKDGKLMTISTPILPDGKGMIVCNLTD